MSDSSPLDAQKALMQNAMLKFSSKIAIGNKLPASLPKEFGYAYVIVKNGLDLAENIFTVYMFSDQFTFGAVFLTFIVVGLVKYFLEEIHHKIDHYAARKVLTLLRIGTEVVEGLFYIYYCGKTRVSIIFFSVFMSVQSFPLVWNFFAAREIDVDNKTWTEIIAVGLYSSIFFNSLPVWIAFTSAGSPFQGVGFQLFLTIYTCLLAASFDLASCAIEMKEESEEAQRAADESEAAEQAKSDATTTAADPTDISSPPVAPKGESDEEEACEISPAMQAIKDQLAQDRVEAVRKGRLKTAAFYYWTAVMVNALYFSIVSFIYIVPYYRRGTNTQYDHSICLLFLVCGGIFFGCLFCILTMLGCLFGALGPDALTQLREANEDHTPEQKAMMRAAELLYQMREQSADYEAAAQGEEGGGGDVVAVIDIEVGETEMDDATQPH